MSIIRNRLQKNFTTLPNAIIIEKISAQAFRMYCYLISKPDGWIVLNNDIKLQLDIKDDKSIAKYWKELITTGWVIRHKTINEDGKFSGGYDYQLNEMAILPDEQENLITKKSQLRKNANHQKIPKQLIKTDLLIKTKEQDHINTNKHLFDFDGFSEQEKLSIEAWMQHKKEKRQSFTPTSLPYLRNKLIKFKKDDKNIIDIIEHSIASNWTGLFEPTVKNNNPSIDRNARIREAMHNTKNLDYSTEF